MLCCFEIESLSWLSFVWLLRFVDFKISTNNTHSLIHWIPVFLFFELVFGGFFSFGMKLKELLFNMVTNLVKFNLKSSLVLESGQTSSFRKFSVNGTFISCYHVKSFSFHTINKSLIRFNIVLNLQHILFIKVTQANAHLKVLWNFFSHCLTWVWKHVNSKSIINLTEMHF